MSAFDPIFGWNRYENGLKCLGQSTPSPDTCWKCMQTLSVSTPQSYDSGSRHLWLLTDSTSTCTCHAARERYHQRGASVHKRRHAMPCHFLVPWGTTMRWHAPLQQWPCRYLVSVSRHQGGQTCRYADTHDGMSGYRHLK